MNKIDTNKIHMIYMTEDSADILDQLNQKIPELIDLHDINGGLAFALIREGKVVGEGSFGLQNIERKIAVTESTVFASASIAKPVVAYLTLKLVEKGKLALDESLQNYLEEPYLENQPLLKLITTRHVLTHTTGFPAWGDTRYSPKIYFTPGERFSYSNESFIYLQTILEKVSQMNLDKIFHKYMGSKFGFKDAGFIWKPKYEDIAAFGYLRDGTNITAKPEHPTADGSLFMSAKDYATFVCSLMTRQTKKKHHLKEDTIQRMLSPEIPANDAGLSNVRSINPAGINLDENVFWGLGWGLEKIDSTYNYFHWGNNGRFYNLAIANRDGFGFVLFGNSQMTPFVWREITEITMPGDHPALDRLNIFFEL
jgi:CubicO group peptidase (beta-lactamase class C family)